MKDWEVDMAVERQREEMYGYNDPIAEIPNVWLERFANEEMDYIYTMWDEAGCLVKEGFLSVEDAESYAKKHNLTIIEKPSRFK